MRADDTHDDALQIRALLERWAAAVRRKDLDAVMAAHAPELVMFDVPPPFRSDGLDAYRKTWAVFFAWSRDPAVFDIEELTVTAGRDVAFAVAAMRCAGAESGHERAELPFRLTVGLEKRDGRWLITHEHHSIPAE